MMKIDRDLVLHIASLANIELDEVEVEMFVKQLGDILHYIEKLGEVKEPEDLSMFCDYLIPQTRTDEHFPSLPVAEATANAPARSGQFFKVPRIIP